MTSARYTRAREMAGLSIAQAAKLLHISTIMLHCFEAGTMSPYDHTHTDIADAYGVSPAWLRGADPVVPASAKRALDKATLGRLEREELFELFGAIYTPGSRR